MSQAVCPWWIGYLLASPIRRLWCDPRATLAPYIGPGMTVLEPGPGMGFFTLDLARLVGPQGRVVAIDIQPRMLQALQRRAARAGLADRIDARLVNPDSLGLQDLAGKVDFTLAFAMIHELPAAAPFFRELAQASREGARVLIAEPTGHVKPAKFEEELRAAEQAGFVRLEAPPLRGNRTALLEKA